MGIVFVLTLFGALMETIGVALIPVFVALLNSPGDVLAFLDARGFSSFTEGQTVRDLIFSASVGLASFFLLKNGFLIALAYVQTGFVADQHTKLARRLLTSYLHKPYTFHLNRNTAELLRNVNIEVVNIFLGVLIPGFVLVSEIMVVLMIGLLLAVVEPVSSLVAVFTVSATGLLYYRLIRVRLGEIGRAQQQHSAGMVKWVNQGLGGVKETKVLGRESFFIEAYRQHVVPYTRSSRLLQTANHIPRYLIESVAVVGVTAMVAAMVWGGREVEKVLPSLALFAIGMLRMMPSMNRIVASANSIRYHRAALDAVHTDLIEKAEAVQSSVAPTQPDAELSFVNRIELRSVSYRYPGATGDALRDISLVIPKGASVAFVGPSGAGKTTVADIILGLLTPTGGTVSVDGIDIQGCMPVWQSKIGYIPQSIYLSDDTIRRNVAFGLADERISDTDVWAALEAAQLSNLVSSLPHQLDTPVGERGIRISGGQRQRIGIARALYHRPDLLVMDEATAALDNRTEREITEALDRLRGEKTLVVIAHRLSTVQKCDTLFFMMDGRVMREGSYEDLLENCGEFQLMVG